jgi:antitoxin (DNA-binding transcriptional repressor) of toxin-antitoxin stability system
MTITVKLGDAKAVLSELLPLVEAGEEVVISRGETAVARLSPIAAVPGLHAEFTEEQLARRRAVIEEIIAFRDRMPSATAEEIDEWKKEGRR